MSSRPDIWENTNIALVSADPSSFPDEVLTRLRRRHWNISTKATSIPEAFDSLQKGRCSILLVHDTPELPATFILRAQIVDPIATITPTIVVAHESHNQDQHLIKDLGMPELIESPINPAAFISSFEFLIKRWSVGNLKRLYQARHYLLQRQYLPFSKLLISLKAEAEVQPLVTPCTAQILLRQADYKGVEILLLNALKEHPRNVGIIANLAEFYLRAAMPDMALKLLLAARKNHGSARILFSDQIQAHLMLNQVAECIPLLEILVKENYCRRQASDFLARCLFAEGYTERCQTVLNERGFAMQDFTQQWHKIAG